MNNVILTYKPERVFVGIITLKFCIYETVTTFNNSQIGKLMLTIKLPETYKHDEDHWWRRIAKGETTQQGVEKKIRRHKHLLKRRLEDNFSGQVALYASEM